MEQDDTGSTERLSTLAEHFALATFAAGLARQRSNHPAHCPLSKSQIWPLSSAIHDPNGVVDMGAQTALPRFVANRVGADRQRAKLPTTNEFQLAVEKLA